MSSDKLKIGIAGLGYWGPNLLRNLLGFHDIPIFAYDTDKNQVKKIKNLFPQAVYVNSFSELLSEVNGVVIATPVNTHYKLAAEALSNGKDVFVEKPLTISSKEAQRLVELAEQKKQVLMVGHTFLYNPAVRKIHEYIENGEIGDIYYITMTRINLGIHRKDVDVVWDLGVHDLTILLYWLGAEPLKIFKISGDYVSSKKQEVAFIDMKFPKGIIANIHVSWLAPSKIRNAIIVGSKKMIVYNDTSTNEKVKVYNAGVDIKDPFDYGEFLLTYRTGDILIPKISSEEPLKLEMQHFIDCIRERKTPLTDGREGLKVVKILESISAL